MKNGITRETLVDTLDQLGARWSISRKKLERERFHWPRSVSQAVRLSGRELNFLLDGFDLTKWRPHERLYYEYVA